MCEVAYQMYTELFFASFQLATTKPAAQYVKSCHFDQGCTFWGHENLIFALRPQKLKFRADFWRDENTGFTLIDALTKKTSSVNDPYTTN